MTEQNTERPRERCACRSRNWTTVRPSSRRRWRAAEPPIAETASEASAAELTKRLELIEEVKRTAMRQDVDYGLVREPTSRACSNRARRSWRSFSSSTCSRATSQSGARANT